MSENNTMPYGDVFNHDPDMDDAMRAQVLRGLGLGVEPTPAGDAEAPRGPDDVVQTGDIELKPTAESSVGLVALIDGDSEL